MYRQCAFVLYQKKEVNTGHYTVERKAAGVVLFYIHITGVQQRHAYMYTMCAQVVRCSLSCAEQAAI